MPKKLTLFLANLLGAAVIFGVFSLTHLPVFAHPIDVTSVDLYVNHDSVNDALPNNQMQIQVGISWQQAAALVEKATGVSVKEITDLTKYDQPYYDYYAQHVKITNNGQACTIHYFDVPDRSEDELTFGTGVLSIGSITCDEPLDNMQLTVSLFTADIPTQNNYITVLDGPDTTVIGALLTSSKTDFFFDMNSNTPPTATSTTSSNTSGPTSSSPFLTKLSQQFVQAKGKSLLWAMGIVFLIGLLHTLEAGHSKVIIGSYMLQKKATIKTGFWYTVVFTITHISDILILGVLFIIANSFVDLYSRLGFLQTFSLYALVAVAIYMFFKNLSEYIQHRIQAAKHHRHGPGEHHAHDHDHGHDHEHAHHGHSHELRADVPLRDQLMMGFITGLAPCLMGWSIFLVVLQSKQLWTLFPIILSFGGGIFAGLMGVVWLVHTFKKPIMGKVSWLGEISPILSALLLLGFALWALW